MLPKFKGSSTKTVSQCIAVRKEVAGCSESERATSLIILYEGIWCSGLSLQAYRTVFKIIVMKIDSSDIGAGMVLVVIAAGIIGFGTILFKGCVRMEKSRKSVGKSLVYEGDTVMIVRYKGLNGTFVLSDGTEMDCDLGKTLIIEK